MAHSQFVTIRNGSYRNEPIEGRFAMIRPWKDGAKGGFVTVQRGRDTIRIKCAKRDCTVTDAAGTEVRMPAPVGSVLAAAQACFSGSGSSPEAEGEMDPLPATAEEEYLAIETEAEAIKRIRDNFAILDDMTRACVSGAVRALIVSGPPGIGKSFGVEKILEEANCYSKIAGKSDKGLIVKGAATPISLYKMLYHYRNKDNILVFDDCDSVFSDPISLNLLKAALDTGDRRFLSWNAESRVLKDEEIPDRFEFKGSVIFLTNLDFDHCRSKMLLPHLQALKSRCLYLNLEINSVKDLMLRIRQVMEDGMLHSYDFEPEVEEEVYQFIATNSDALQEISLRTIKKVADLRKNSPRQWRELALHTVMKKEARFRYLLEAKKAQAKK